MIFVLKKYRGVASWHWILMQNLKENWRVLSKMTWRIWQIFVQRLKNRDFILESKMVKLNQNKNSTTRSSGCRVKTLFYLGNKWTAQLTKIFTHVLPKLGSFLQCSVHIFLGDDDCVWKIDSKILWNHTMK